MLEVVLFKERKKNLVNMLSTFVLINFAWIFFRANSISDAFYIVKTITTNMGELYIGRGLIKRPQFMPYWPLPVF